MGLRRRRQVKLGSYWTRADFQPDKICVLIRRDSIGHRPTGEKGMERWRRRAERCSFKPRTPRTDCRRRQAPRTHRPVPAPRAFRQSVASTVTPGPEAPEPTRFAYERIKHRRSESAVSLLLFTANLGNDYSEGGCVLPDSSVRERQGLGRQDVGGQGPRGEREPSEQSMSRRRGERHPRSCSQRAESRARAQQCGGRGRGQLWWTGGAASLCSELV